MSSEVIFSSEVSQIEKVNSKRHKNLLHEVKKHSRTSPEIQFKELNEKLRIFLPDQQINSTMPAKT